LAQDGLEMGCENGPVENLYPMAHTCPGRNRHEQLTGMLKKAASGVLALVPCSRTGSTLRAPKGLRPCWTDFFEHSKNGKLLFREP